MYSDPVLPIIYFDSVAEQARVAAQLVSATYRREWDDNEREFDEAVAVAQTGDYTLVEQAEVLMNKFNFVAETTGRHYEPSHAGAFPVVPDFLHGEPACMRRMTQVQNESMPIKIVVGCTGSSGMSSDAMMQRGIAILALVMAIAKHRPVSLEMICSVRGAEVENGEDYVITRAQVQTSPLDLASAGFAVTSTTFQRCFGFGLCDAVARRVICKPDGTPYNGTGAGSGGWQYLLINGRLQNITDNNLVAYHGRMKEIMGLGEEDIYVPEIYGTDDTIGDDHVGWVRKHLRGLNLIVENV